MRLHTLIKLGLGFLFAACAVKDDGLVAATDGGRDAGPTSFCPAGVVENASWSPAITVGSCTQPCGPDLLGSKLCKRVDLATCQQSGDCICSSDLCTSCVACAFTELSKCYLPSNADKLPACASSVHKFDACDATCNRKGCLLADGKTACLCNPNGYYACAPFKNGNWH